MDLELDSNNSMASGKTQQNSGTQIYQSHTSVFGQEMPLFRQFTKEQLKSQQCSAQEILQQSMNPYSSTNKSQLICAMDQGTQENCSNLIYPYQKGISVYSQTLITSQVEQNGGISHCRPTPHNLIFQNESNILQQNDNNLNQSSMNFFMPAQQSQQIIYCNNAQNVGEIQKKAFEGGINLLQGSSKQFPSVEVNFNKGAQSPLIQQFRNIDIKEQEEDEGDENDEDYQPTEGDEDDDEEEESIEEGDCIASQIKDTNKEIDIEEYLRVRDQL